MARVDLCSVCFLRLIPQNLALVTKIWYQSLKPKYIEIGLLLLNVDVSCSSSSAQRIVYLQKCFLYKRFAKFQRASKKVKEPQRQNEEVSSQWKLPRAK